MNETQIEWTDVTWNPMSGCARISAGCAFCYAHTLAENKRGTAAFPAGFDLTIRPHKLREPYRLKKPSLIFTNSMSDLFWDQIPDDYRRRVIDVIADTPQHQYQVLTKRPDTMLRVGRELGGYPDNMWCGVSVEDARATKRIDALRDVPASVRFLSVEPLLSDLGPLDLSGIHWVITGGESGVHLSRPEMQLRRGLAWRRDGRWEPIPDRIDWVRRIRDACQDQGVAFLHKQWGGVRPKSAGRLLDGRTWDEYPRQPGHGLSPLLNAAAK